MLSIHNPPAAVYFIARTGSEVVHHGIVEPGCYMDSGQETLEQFATEAEQIARLAELGVTIPTPE